MDLTEKNIWREIQQKNVKTFESYYKKHYKSFFLISCKYLKSYTEAEEIVNDVFMKIWEDGHNISIETSLKSYIYKASINRSLNLIQQHKKDLLQKTDLS